VAGPEPPLSRAPPPPARPPSKPARRLRRLLLLLHHGPISPNGEFNVDTSEAPPKPYRCLFPVEWLPAAENLDDHLPHPTPGCLSGDRPLTGVSTSDGAPGRRRMGSLFHSVLSSPPGVWESGTTKERRSLFPSFPSPATARADRSSLKVCRPPGWTFSLSRLPPFGLQSQQLDGPPSSFSCPAGTRERGRQPRPGSSSPPDLVRLFQSTSRLLVASAQPVRPSSRLRSLLQQLRLAPQSLGARVWAAAVEA
jgi:hypothetical protein